MRLQRLTLIRPNMGDYRTGDALPPLALGILAARTPSPVDVALYDDRVEPLPEGDTPDMMAMSVETFSARRAYEIADGYRRRGITVVMGGYHPSALPEEALQHADAVVVGDAEGSWERLLTDYEQGALKSLYTGGNRHPLAGPPLDRTLFHGKRYAPLELVQFGRGCRFSCDFCSIQSFYRGETRTRALADLVAEIASLRKNRLLFFVDDNLFSSKAAFDALLRAVKPMKRRWCCQISMDVARDETLLDRMAEAGCVLALLGFESLSEHSLKQMGKSWNRVAGDYLDVVKRFHRRGMAIYGTFAFGYDGDTPDSIERGLEFAMEARLEMANFNPLTPTPGTPLYERLLKEGRMLRPRWWLDADYRYGDPIFRPAGMSPEVLAEHCFAARQAFYSWRSIGTRVFGARSGLSWFKTGILGLANLVSRKEIYRKQHRVLGV